MFSKFSEFDSNYIKQTGLSVPLIFHVDPADLGMRYVNYVSLSIYVYMWFNALCTFYIFIYIVRFSKE